MIRKRDDRAGASLALLLVLLALGLGGATGEGKARRRPEPVKTWFLEAAGDVARPGVHAFAEGPVKVRDLAAAAGAANLELPDHPGATVPASGSRVVFLRKGAGAASVRIDRMGGFQCMTLGIPLSVNHASPEDLTALPGVGPSLAAAMVEYRRKTKGFEREEDLLKVYGVGHGLLGRVRPHITVP